MMNFTPSSWASLRIRDLCPTTAAILRIREGVESEVLVSGLAFPTSIDFDGPGNGYVTINGVGAPVQLCASVLTS